MGYFILEEEKLDVIFPGIKMHLNNSSKICGAFIIFISVLSVCAWQYECPNLSAKCRCSPNGETKSNDVQCRRLDSNELHAVFMEASGYEFNKLQIVDSSLIDLNEDISSNISVNIIEIKFCQIETCYLFRGLNSLKNLKTLVFDEISANRFLPCLSNEDKFIQMREFVLLDSPLREIEHALFIQWLPKHLTSISIELSKLKLKEYVFLDKFKNLQKLDLSRNQLESFNRNHLPRPALNLSFYSLSQNPIMNLANDSFEDMPALRYLYLDGTALMIISEAAFKPILKQIVSLQLAHTPLVCEKCLNLWLIDYASNWKGDFPTCNVPKRLKGKRIQSLDREEICPYLIKSYRETMFEYCRMRLGNANTNVTND